MEKNPLAGIEFFGFMALAAWLVYHQFIAARRDRQQSEEPGDEDRWRHRADATPSDTPGQRDA
jgi:hypothetical protein